MILHDVANRANSVVKTAPAFHTEIFRHRDLHAFDVMAIPERLDEGIRESEHQQVVHGPLPEIMIDAEYARLVESRAQRRVQLTRGREIPAKRLFEDHPRVPPALGLLQVL